MEEWRVIADHPNYEASSLGRIRRVGKARAARAGRILRSGITWNGYRFFVASSHCEKTQVYVHIAVARAFLGPPPTGRVVNHRNGKKLDCRAENLEYMTQSENVRHAFELGLQPRGSERMQAKLTEKDVPLINELRDDGWSQRKIAEHIGVSQSIISDVLNHKRWKHAQKYSGG